MQTCLKGSLYIRQARKRQSWGIKKKKGHHNTVITAFADSVSFCDDATETFLIIQKKVCLAALSFNA